MNPRVLAALATADFRERVRRPAYLVVLAGAVGLGYLTVPDPAAQWVIFDAGGYRGVYHSAYVGTVTALAGGLWFSLAGFYVVRGVVRRDERTGVGQVLAATPVRTVAYLLGKFVSNLLVLASMAGVLAATAVVMQLARGESRTVEPVSLLAPFLLLALPVLAVTAALALLFDTVAPLRAGLGNVVWFFAWLFLVGIGGQGTGAPLGGLGTGWVTESIRREMAAQGIAAADAEFGLGLMQRATPLATVDWPGLELTGQLAGARLLLLLLAVAAAAVPVLWFGRFGPARTRHRAARGPAGPPSPPATSPVLTGYSGPPRTAVRTGATLLRLCAGELRLLARAGSRWWWAAAAALAVAASLVPYPLATGPVLLAAWVWPVVLWSRLGTQRAEQGLVPLLRAYPAVHRQLLAEWLAGVAVTALLGAAPMLRMLVAADWAGLVAWSGAVLFIPALALALGAWSQSPRLFQVCYLALWFLLVNGAAALDFTGAVRVDGAPVGVPPLLVAGAAGLLLAAAGAASALRHAYR